MYDVCMIIIDLDNFVYNY